MTNSRWHGYCRIKHFQETAEGPVGLVVSLWSSAATYRARKEVIRHIGLQTTAYHLQGTMHKHKNLFAKPRPLAFGIANVLSLLIMVILLILVFPLSLFSQDSSPASSDNGQAVEGGFL